MIKLNTNENPYPPAPGVDKGPEGDAHRHVSVKYPDPTAAELVHALAQNYGAGRMSRYL